MTTIQPYWTPALARIHIHAFDELTPEQQERLIVALNTKFPPDYYFRQRDQRNRAISNARQAVSLFARSTLAYPALLQNRSPEPAAGLSGCALIFTAGGEGERLRVSLRDKGIPESKLADFTKAAYPLPGWPGDFGALQINLALISHICTAHGLSVPVIITTGPAGSTTAKVIPRVLETHANFGLAHVKVIEQDERLHLTAHSKIAWHIADGRALPVTNPDETGGPIMKLKAREAATGRSTLHWLRELGCAKLIVLQATALYDPALIFSMAAAAQAHDGLGVGILRSSFPANDPFGTFALVKEQERDQLMIVEQDLRTPELMRLQDPTGTWFLPYNTGFYVFDADLLMQASLPDYATPPKEVIPGLPRAPKIGYAATDILPLAKNPAVLAIDQSRFAVIKKAEDLEALAALGKQFGLDRICAEVNIDK